MTKSRTKQSNRAYLDDEIDLTPYINRILARKWIIIAIVALFTLAGYLGSLMIPPKYQANGTIVFTGFRTTGGGTAQFIVSPASAISMIQQIANSYPEELIGVSELTAVGIEFPLTLTFIIDETTDVLSISDFLIDSLNSNPQVISEIDSRRESLSSQLSTTQETIDEIDQQISKAKQASFNCSAESAALGAAYADLVALRENLISSLNSLQTEYDSLTGFQYVATPYLINGGAPVSPKKIQNAAVAGFLGGGLSVGAFAFIKSKEERK